MIFFLFTFTKNPVIMDSGGGIMSDNPVINSFIRFINYLKLILSLLY